MALSLSCAAPAEAEALQALFARVVGAASNALLEKLGFRRLCVLANHWHGQDYVLWELSPP